MAGLKKTKRDSRDYSFFKRPHVKTVLGAAIAWMFNHFKSPSV